MDSLAALPCATVLSPASYWTPCRSSLVGSKIAVSVEYDDELDYYLDAGCEQPTGCVDADPATFTCACCLSRPVKNMNETNKNSTIDEYHDDFSDAETLSPCSSPTSSSFHVGFEDEDEELEMQEQSPIDIRTDAVRFGALAEDGVLITSGTIDAELVHKGTNFSVCVNSNDHANTITLKGKTYHAIQFHFHTPSEHTFDGQHEAMEFHLVHQAEDGSLAVVAVFFRMGEENPFLAQFWDELQDLSQGIPTKIPLGEIDIRTLGIPSGHFLRYRGSLTTPPYSEGVEWVVVQDVAEASREQLNVFYDMLTKPNARATQPLNKRSVRMGWGLAI